MLRILAVSVLLGALATTSLASAQERQHPAPLQSSDFMRFPDAQVELGRLLFYDRVLSGTYRVSCATCHNHDRASSNGVLLKGEEGPGEDEVAIGGLTIYQQLKPSDRHAPALFNLGHRSFTRLFSDGRVSVLENGSYQTPANTELPTGLNSVLAAQALFPAITDDELVGTVDNDIKSAAHLGNRAIWEALAQRVSRLEPYHPYFERAYPDLVVDQRITIVSIANAIAAFVATEWRTDDSPYDRWLRGDPGVLSAAAIRGEALFSGRAGCSTCHAGALQTDNRFHAVGSSLWSFRKSNKGDLDDVLKGRFSVTGNQEDLFRFRTPSLRNVADTAPYGIAGSHEKLEEFVAAHADPRRGLDRFLMRRFGAAIPAGVQSLRDQLVRQNELSSVTLSEQDRTDLVAFLTALTDQSGLVGRLGKPSEVPSDLALD